MIAPWKFKCENLHIQFDAAFCHERLSLKISDALSFLPKEATISQRMLLTISKMHSTCYSDNDFIVSHEVIMKVMIALNSVLYYYPILAIVDAPHSITRGAFLGYAKHIGEVKFGNSLSHFHMEGVDNFIQFDMSPSEIEEISLLPHLTYRHYRTPDFEAKGLSVIDITDHIASPISKCTSLAVDFPFLEQCGITPLSPYKVGMISDSFTVLGASYV
ncbi:hypothetical protein Q6A51_16185 [Pseudomonas sp. KFB-139]|uniref:Uncharacterized protein n=1 Tax=Pseudomonas serbiensis TaxID=3064350 RepID=A0ABT9CS57_9PSED|nr:hypothetical protein [Pseudomonas sp. KFB-138]MDO7928329.1 hypothetical protein [Pseudomonas sp. KFB-138]